VSRGVALLEDRDLEDGPRIERARTSLKTLLRRGVNRGIFPTALDEDLGVVLLLRPMLYRHIFGSSVSLDWLAEGAVDSFWKAHVRPSEKTKPSQPKKKLPK